MPAYQSQEGLSLTLEELWRFLGLHTTSAITEIHPEILQQEVVSSSPTTTVLRRTIEVQGKQHRSTWKVTLDRPHGFRWDIVEGDGPWHVGSFLENRYSVEGGRVRVTTRGDLQVMGVPGPLQGRIVAGVMDRVSEQDVAYLQAHPTTRPGP